MSMWTQDELNKVGKAEELEIAVERTDGSLRKPLPIWVVRVGDDLFVRSVKAKQGTWYKAAVLSHAAHIQAGGVSKGVRLVEEDDATLNGQIDAAYQSKYSRYPQHVAPMVTDEVHATTFKLLPG